MICFKIIFGGDYKMWTTIYVITDLKRLKMVEKLLQDEGFLVKIIVTSDLDSKNIYEIAVLKNEAKDAQEFLIEKRVI